MTAITNAVMTPNAFMFQLGQACPHLGTWPSWISPGTGNFGYQFVGDDRPRNDGFFSIKGEIVERSRYRKIYNYASIPHLGLEAVRVLDTPFLDDAGTLEYFVHKPLKNMVPDLRGRLDQEATSGRLNSSQLKEIFEMEETTVMDAVRRILDGSDSLRPAVSWFAEAALSYGQQAEIFLTGGDDLQTAASIIGAVVLFNALGSGDKSANVEALSKAVRILNSNSLYASLAFALGLKADHYEKMDEDAARNAHEEAAQTWLKSVDFYWSERPARVISIRYGLEEALQSGKLYLIDEFHIKAADHHTQEKNNNLAAEELLRAAQAHLERTVAPGHGASVEEETNWAAVEDRLRHAYQRLQDSQVPHPDINLSAIKRLKDIAYEMPTGKRGK
ncbi:MAG: hypothetical protein WC683_16225 [bacterium]